MSTRTLAVALLFLLIPGARQCSAQSPWYYDYRDNFTWYANWGQGPQQDTTVTLDQSGWSQRAYVYYNGSYYTRGYYNATRLPGLSDTVSITTYSGDSDVPIDLATNLNVGTFQFGGATTPNDMWLNLNGHTIDADSGYTWGYESSTDTAVSSMTRFLNGNVNIANALEWGFSTVEVGDAANLTIGTLRQGVYSNGDEHLRVLNGGTFTMDAMSANITYDSTEFGIDVEAGGQLTATGSLNLGDSYDPGFGSLRHAGNTVEQSGNFNVAQNLNIGDGTQSTNFAGPTGTAVFNQSAGTTLVGGTTTLSSDGTLNINGGTIQTTSLINSGGSVNHRDGTVTIDGGTFNPGASMVGSAADYHLQGATTSDHSIVTLKNGAQWNGEMLTVARGRDGTLSIESGSTVLLTDSLVVGRSDGVATGTVNVDGAGSTLTTVGDIDVGRFENGVLAVTNGAAVSSQNGNIGARLGSNGTATVDGVDSQWSMSGDLYVGGRASAAGGPGELSVSNSGHVDVTGITRVWETGALNIDGGSFSTASLTNTGTVNLNDGLLSVSGVFTPGSGFTMTGGELDVNTLSGDWAFSGGILDATTVDGNLTQSGGILAPGNSPGVTTVTGDYLLGGGVLEMELEGLVQGTEYDFLDVSGDWTITGGDLNVTLLGGFNPLLGDSFDLFDFNSLTGTFDNVFLPTLDTGLQWNTASLYSTGTLSVDSTAVPEPSAWFLLMVGTTVAGAVSCRRRTQSTAQRQRSPFVPG